MILGSVLAAVIALVGSVTVFALTRIKDRQQTRAQFAMEAFTRFVEALTEARTQEGFLKAQRDLDPPTPDADPEMIRAGHFYYTAMDKLNSSRGQMAVVLPGRVVTMLARIQERRGGFKVADEATRADLAKVARALRADFGAKDDDLTDDQLLVLMFSEPAPSLGTQSGVG